MLARSLSRKINASMRPERKAPDNIAINGHRFAFMRGFNEAGAKSPG